ncbi:hypothetical protein P879_10723 [Paragonimus westermani]|uniref:Glycoside hydrolase family 38 central domain-containing protein n=1 Tax=Paragonimus westermani TaxID=34504 RepID=A0A8T0DET5_9TREM|nr:hypothetical protein P879_10723 [Paragonimus westermani]
MATGHLFAGLTLYPPVNVFSNRIANFGRHSFKDPHELLVDRLRQAMGVMQHHDAVTGTEKQHVADDYAMTLSQGSSACQSVIAEALMNLLPNLSKFTGNNLPVFCDLLNISLCSATDGWKPYLNSSGQGGVYIFLYNPVAWNLWHSWLRIPLYIASEEMNKVEVIIRDLRDPEGPTLPYQILPISERTMEIPERRLFGKQTNVELTFNPASTGHPAVPAGFTTFYLALERKRQNLRTARVSKRISCAETNTVSRTTRLRLELTNRSIPLMVHAEHVASGMKLTLMVEMLYYFGETNGSQSSGAYVFLPKARDMLQQFEKPTYQVSLIWANHFSCFPKEECSRRQIPMSEHLKYHTFT